MGWDEAGTSGVGYVTALAGFSKGLPYTLPCALGPAPAMFLGVKRLRTVAGRTTS